MTSEHDCLERILDCVDAYFLCCASDAFLAKSCIDDRVSRGDERVRCKLQASPESQARVVYAVVLAVGSMDARIREVRLQLPYISRV